MIVSIHQPNYMPWLGYFVKLYVADKFIFLDNVKISKGAFTNRTKIYSKDKAEENNYLNIGVLGKSFSYPINEVEISDRDWLIYHELQLFTHYGQFPFYNEVKDIFQELIDVVSENDNLAVVNEMSVRILMNKLDIQCELLQASSMSAKTGGTQRIIDLMNEVGGTNYFTGRGFSKYVWMDIWDKSGLKLNMVNFMDYFVDNKISENVETSELSNSIIHHIAKYGTSHVSDYIRTIASKMEPIIN